MGGGRNLGCFHEAKLQNPDPAQTRGGSRPLVETQQVLEAKYGPEKATIINTYCCMKSGLKNCDSSGNSGPITSEVANKRVADYTEALQEKYPDNWQDQPFDAQVMYDSTGGLTGGRLAIADGAIKKADIIEIAKQSGIRPSNSRCYQTLLRRYGKEVAANRILLQQNATLTRQVSRTNRIVELICRKVDLEITPDMLEEEENDVSTPGDGSCHASVNLDSDGH